MEEEQLFSGFCRQQDQTRRVFFSYEVTQAANCPTVTVPFSTVRLPTAV